MKVTVNRADPTPPPVDNVTIVLTPQEAVSLKKFILHNFNRYINDDVDSDVDRLFRVMGNAGVQSYGIY